MKKAKITLQKILITIISIVAIISINIPKSYAALSFKDIIGKGSNFISQR